MAILALACLLLGIGFRFVVPALSSVALSLPSLSLAQEAFFDRTAPINSIENTPLSLLFVFVLMLLFGLLVYSLANLFARRQKQVVARLWDCGENLTPRMEITATSFSMSLVSIFKGILRPVRQSDVEYHDANMPYFRTASSVRIERHDLYARYMYEPLTRGALLLARASKWIQNGNVNAYLLYIFVTLIVLLVWVTQ
jgi:hydrogenase-4 component B